jgi:cellulose synthase/poly-beta-1,6-N-acetylglucosamine synthase-like glycosyltransferase
MKIIFWGSFMIMVYVYFGYPFIVGVLSRIRPRVVRKAEIIPEVSIVIAAYNEEANIQEKIHNALNLDYPKDKIEIIVVSDASTDRTDEIVKSFSAEGVVLLQRNERKGKTAAQNAAVTKAKGDIIVFSDANNFIDKNAVRKIVQNFADPDVGCVQGVMQWVSDEDSLTGSGGKFYWDYETRLKRSESLLGSMIGVSGFLYAVRKSIYTPLPEDSLSDFLIALEVYKRGYRSVLEPEAVAREKIYERAGTEFRVRVRTALRAFRVIAKTSWALNPFRYSKLAWQLISHKILRYAVPLFMFLLLLSSIQIRGTFYRIVLSAQFVFYVLAFLGFKASEKGEKNKMIYIPYYFCLVNIASLVAFIEMLKGEKYVTWETIRK